MSDITANVVISMPSQLFTMARQFKAASNGKIYIGLIDTDPQNTANQIQVFLENEDGSHVPVPQPLVINAGGFPVYNGQIAKFVTVQGHSMAIYDSYGTQQFYYPNVLKYDPDQLRQELAGPNGYLLVPSVFTEADRQRWIDTGDIRGWGAVEGEDATDAINAAIKSRAAKGWGTSSDVIINGNYKIEGQVLLTTDVRIIGNWATITSSSDDWIFESAYKNQSGDIVTNHTLADDVAIGTARLKGTVIRGITFVGVSKVFHLSCFTERCGLEDLAFENCGIAWDSRLSFYPYYKNIIIRGVKSGYEEKYSYQLRHQCNQSYLEKITVSSRKYGELIADDITPNPVAQINCQNIHKKQCSYEHVTTGAFVDMTTYGYQDENWYAENVSDNLYIFNSGDHYDTIIGSPCWLYGVEKGGTFNNLKGRSEVYQGAQYDHSPAKRSAMQFNSSIARVIPFNDLGSYSTIANYDSGLIIDPSSTIIISGTSFTNENIPINLNQTNTVSIPVSISGYVKNVAGKAIGVTGASYSSSSDSLNISTDIYWSPSNCILVGVRIFQTSLPSNIHSSTAILLNGFKSQLDGQPVFYEADGEKTIIRITNPGGATDKGWLTSGDFTLEGCVRII